MKNAARVFLLSSASLAAASAALPACMTSGASAQAPTPGREPARSPRRPTSTASRSSTATASSTRTSSTASDPEYKAPWNKIYNNAARLHAGRQGDPDAQLGHAILLARRGPARRAAGPHRAGVEKERYYSVQFIDMYTFNFAYVGSRATGNEAGSFLLAGPDWKGETPKGIKAVIRSRDRVRFVRLPHAAVRSRRHRQREEGPGRLQGRAAVGIPRQAGAHSPARRSTSSSRSRPDSRGPRSSSSTS